jgi:hypothetical protein
MGRFCFDVLSVRALVFVAFAAALPACAGEIRISDGDCATGVHLVAQDARLSDVLNRLARTLGFQLRFQSDSDPLVSINTTRQPADLVTQLSPQENVSVAHARDSRCPNRERIVAVWVLPKTRGGVGTTAAPPTPPVVPVPPPPAPPQESVQEEGVPPEDDPH